METCGRSSLPEIVEKTVKAHIILAGLTTDKIALKAFHIPYSRVQMHKARCTHIALAWILKINKIYVLYQD